MKRKLFSVVLAAAMVLSLTACEKKTISDATGSVSSASAEASVETSVETSTEASVEASVETSTEASVEESGEEEFSVGDVESDVYENEFFNIKVTAAEGFSFADSETIAAIGQYTADAFADSDSDVAKQTADAIASGATITDFYLADEDMITTMNLTISSGKGLKPSMVDALIDQTIPVLEQTFSAQGFLNVKSVRSTTTFCGEEVSCINTTAELPVSETETVPMFVKQVEIIKDGYVACLTCNTYVEDGTDELLKMVTKLN